MSSTSDQTRLAKTFTQLRKSKSKALVSFITVGDPTLDHTLAFLQGLVEGGVDVLELGIPFSDPEAEGPSIQAANERALKGGATLKDVLDQVKLFRKINSDTPIVLMGYLNSIIAMPDFETRAFEAGVDGLIMVNLPPEEGEKIAQPLAAQSIDLIYLLAPTTTKERSQEIVEVASGFLYYVSLKGITGADHFDSVEVTRKVKELKELTDLPICVGFGIKDGETAKKIAPYADGIVVGSAFVDLVAKGGSPSEISARLKEKASELRVAIDSTKVS